jgi:hypothetical protein
MNINIFDGCFAGMGGREMYLAWVMPDLFPHQPQPRVESWPEDELEYGCGIYSPERRRELMQQREESRV